MNLDHNLLVSDVMRNSVAGQIEAQQSDQNVVGLLTSDSI